MADSTLHPTTGERPVVTFSSSEQPPRRPQRATSWGSRLTHPLRAVVSLFPGATARATVDVAAVPPPTPFAPVLLTDEAAVTEILDLAARCADVLLASGTGATDTELQARSVVHAFGLSDVHVEVTFNTISVSARRGPTLPPVQALRVVTYRTTDFTRLTNLDWLLRQITTRRLTPAQAHDELDLIVQAHHPYPPAIAQLAWAGLAASVTALLGATAIMITVSFLTSIIIGRSLDVLGRAGAPLFVQQLAGGFIATVPAAGIYALRDVIGGQLTPSGVIAACIIMLLSGLNLTGSLQDALSGAPITATARLVEVILSTSGIVAGIAIALGLFAVFGIHLPSLGEATSPALTDVPVLVVASGLSAAFFAVASYSPARAIIISGLVAAIGYVVYTLLISVGVTDSFAAGVTAVGIGLSGGRIARHLYIPPVIIGVAGITPFLPGLAVYRGLYGFLNEAPLPGMTNLITATAVAGALAAGLVVGEWLNRIVRRPRIDAMPRFTRQRRSNIPVREAVSE